MVSFVIRLADDDYQALKNLSDAERLPRVEIIRRLIRLEMIHKREEKRRQTIMDQAER